MNKLFTSVGISLRLWISTAALFSLCLFIYGTDQMRMDPLHLLALTTIASFAGSIPALVLQLVSLPFINRGKVNWKLKFFRLLVLQAVISACYGSFLALIDISISGLNAEDGLRLIAIALIAFAVLFACSLSSNLFFLKSIATYFIGSHNMDVPYNKLFSSIIHHTPKNNTTMETSNYADQPRETQSNKLLIKGLVTGGLILLMLIPTIFISKLIEERAARQKEVVKEVNSKWASAQTISGPYIVVPYAEAAVSSDGKPVIIKKQLILLANDLDVRAGIFPEKRSRSIYKVLLYKSNLTLKGSFKPEWPSDVDTANVDFANAKLCFGLSDFKGIEEEVMITVDGKKHLLRPGLPTNDLDSTGLSAPVDLSVEALNAGLSFDMNVKIKGSEQLHFMPLSANSKFSITSSWPDPSFDGNTLPNDRRVDDKGFTAGWNFNRANLPFGTVLHQGSFNKSNLSFGVSMVQPADQYNKTMRSVKYAILFIGLTFALFFIVEIMQRKPFHPVQYVLVGLALVIFYSLLLSISEYLLFDQAYLLAATATILLISMYAKSHFKSWKTAAVFTTVLTGLYGFIFILIRLEDTALIVGSIGLFIVLAIVMYVSRKINWYGAHALVAVKVE